MTRKRRLTLLMLSTIAVVLLLGSGTLAPTAALASAQTFRWDIIHGGTPAGISAGGVAYALANDNTTIKLTGSGTFNSVTGAHTGGGTWATSGPSGTASGTFQVTGFVRFVLAPGSLPPGLPDSIGPNAHSGLLVLRIFFSDGSLGSLVFSCDLPVGSPSGLFEGVTVTKGFVGFWNRVPPVPGIDANRTSFHQL
jgi:hypothetical protein